MIDWVDGVVSYRELIADKTDSRRITTKSDQSMTVAASTNVAVWLNLEIAFGACLRNELAHCRRRKGGGGEGGGEG